jgi:hypothetical protein
MATEENEVERELGTIVERRQRVIWRRAIAEHACSSVNGGWTCTREVGHNGQHAACEAPGSVALVVWGDPENKGAGAAVGWLRRDAALKALREVFGPVDVRLTDSGHDFVVSVDAMERLIEAGTLGPVRDGPVPAAPTGLLARWVKRRRLRNRLIGLCCELEERERDEPIGADDEWAAGRVHGLCQAADLISRVIEELR